MKQAIPLLILLDILFILCKHLLETLRKYGPISKNGSYRQITNKIYCNSFSHHIKLTCIVLENLEIIVPKLETLLSVLISIKCTLFGSEMIYIKQIFEDYYAELIKIYFLLNMKTFLLVICILRKIIT